MIYAELSGGLGNQMFVYAFARAMGRRHHRQHGMPEIRDD